jgi:hypothetical protein
MLAQHRSLVFSAEQPAPLQDRDHRGPWCVLSFEAVALLRQRGYRVRRLEDGFPEWKMAGLPIGQSP